MNPLDHRKNWIAFIHQLRAKQALQPEQFEHLAKVFEEILNGVDANEALGLKYARGNSPDKAMARQKISLVLHWVSCATAPLSDDGLGMSLAAAFEAASDTFKAFGYQPEQIEKYWYQKDKAHMQSLTRGHYDHDSPY